MKTHLKLMALVALTILGLHSVSHAQPDPSRPRPPEQPGNAPNPPPSGGGGGGQFRAPRPGDEQFALSAQEKVIAEMARSGQQMMMAQGKVDNVMSMMGRPDSGRALIVQSSKQDPATTAALEEDLNVMTRIIEKAVSHDGNPNSPDRAMGIFVYSGGRSPQSIYLEGYGALFMVTAKFPLVATPSREQTKSEKPEDSSWEEAKREIYGGRPGQQMGMGMGGFGAVQGRSPRMEFNPEKVENLKKDLLGMLKNASNIRNLKHDDNIVVVVSSPDGGGMFDQRLQSIVRMQPPGGDRPGDESGREPATSKPEPRPKTNRSIANSGGGFRTTGNAGGPRASTLTIRVKKSDVDSFAAGKMDFDDFRKKASVVAY